ncbi:hypothetical protein RN001_000523 [Aquatica leii]|uniref:Putative nuclease HARBI1 n=1 Tax=Aquatica leii TaxID=1421715 RepID=A0AAN7SJ67_9COLE|nr:hypothetical protein RN001_000523 [Aquatica leii]
MDFEDVEDLEVIEFIEFGLPRQIYQRNDYFHSLDDFAFRKRFRLTRECVLHLLTLIEHHLEYPLDINNCVSPMNQLLVCLRMYSTGGHLQMIADFAGMHYSTVSRIVKRVSEAIASLYPQHVKFPATELELKKCQQDFYNVASFPRVIGAIDCTHISIQSPGGNDAEIYRNRKQYFSINVQAICNSNLKLMNVVARWPGSVHDATIFRHSNIYNRFENNLYENCILIGDNGYFNTNYLLTPLLQPITPGQQLYNESHIRSRNCIERCFGVLKRRFPILAYGCRLHINTLLTIIIATSVVHNIALEMGDIQPPPLPQELDEHVQDEGTTRQRYINWFSNL